MSNAPKYIHDCKGCKYIHTVTLIEDGYTDVVDWYFCDSRLGGSLIGRFDDEGSRYWSAPIEVIKSAKSLGSKYMEHAKKLAKEVKSEKKRVL